MRPRCISFVVPDVVSRHSFQCVPCSLLVEEGRNPGSCKCCGGGDGESKYS